MEGKVTGQMKVGSIPLAPLGGPYGPYGSYDNELKKIAAEWDAQVARQEVNHKIVQVQQISDVDTHLADALKYLASYPPSGAMGQPTREKTAADLKTADMIMELLGRGYAVIKIPEGGGLPEVLKGSLDAMG